MLQSTPVMKFQDFLKKWKRAAARNGLFATTWIFIRLPYGLVRFLTRILMAVGFCFAVKQKRIAIESLKIAFGAEKDAREINKIFTRCFDNIGWGMCEMIYFMAHPSMIKEKVTIEGKKYLENALRLGNGVITVSAHFGSFPLMLLRLAQEGFPLSAIIRPARDEVIEEYFLSLRTRLGLKTIYAVPRKTCVDQSLKVLRNNEVLFIPLDQNFGSGGGVFVDFFGQKAATATGPVVFAQRTKAPIIPMFIIRERGDQHKILIEPPLDLEQRENHQETIEVNVAKISKLIEQYIRCYPEEWGWMHRRWKTKPQEVLRESG